MPVTEPVKQKKPGRGPAKCTEFNKLRKHGKIPLKISDGEMAPCCENVEMFTTRISWILKHNADMSYYRWTDVPKADKDELIERVRGDLELDWDLYNHRMAVMKALHKRFSAFHCGLHKKYLSYGSHEEALASGSILVNPLVWAKLCERWGSDSFKKISNQNRENRKKHNINHKAGRKSFVRILEEKKEMVEKMNSLEPEKRTEESVAAIFREVLGHKAGYAKGLGEMVIPESTRERDRQRDKEYATLVERHQKDAEYHKPTVEVMKGDMIKMMERQLETDKILRWLLAE
ncbi:uncharacterized protein LOC122289083 [Carya illinoinensis]|uniref:uncharacterized protein LOC122289083 n=1 Tax=Carya illinoinensis TaxID=32201 RepID=UPI001C722B75|nr:uncharacterized protein LOC122289083 [Carya illinoinensis]XP_042951940.1 uncharacterized protein LOC122289083 [Carya illinoinensis]